MIKKEKKKFLLKLNIRNQINRIELKEWNHNSQKEIKKGDLTNKLIF